MSDVQQLKLWILDLVDLSKDAIHVHLGLLVFLTAAVLTRDVRSLWPWLAAAVAAVGIELFDLRDDWATFGRLRWGASVHDVINTLLWPTVLTILGRSVLRSNAAPGGADASGPLS